jgi:UDP-glucuronate 4-epimerase
MILITGTAGFIGNALALKLLEKETTIIGIDNHNDYYDIKLKDARLDRIKKFQNYIHYRVDLANTEQIAKLFAQHKPKIVVNLAAQAGVRYSLENPLVYINSNVLGFTNILENCKKYNVDHLVYASTSSVYGANTNMPFNESQNTNHQLSLYAVTKKSNELMAHAYSYLYKLPCTGLRFFTVYGPWGRPDMALFKFTKNILENKPLDLFNYGKHTRDFTYIDDIVDSIIKVIDNPAVENLEWDSSDPDPATSKFPWKIYNIGNSKPIKLTEYIKVIENVCNKRAQINPLPMQKGDVQDTYASSKLLQKHFDYKPSTPIEEGVTKFVQWFKDYYKFY